MKHHRTRPGTADAVRFEVQVKSVNRLVGYMRFRRETVRSLARKVGASPATIGHLRSGARATCRPELALAIAEALNAPVDELFMPRMSPVSSARRHVVAA